jgi:hypothetical protein
VDQVEGPEFKPQPCKNKQTNKQKTQTHKVQMHEQSSTFLVIKKTQNKSTLRFHLTPVSVGIIKKTNNTKAGKDAGKKGSLHTHSGNVNESSQYGSSSKN